MNTAWHFWLMIAASLIIFLLMIHFVAGKTEFRSKRGFIFLLAFLIVVIGMVLGKYGAKIGLPWWVYYPVPMLATLLIPPFLLKFNKRQTMLYIMMSFLSAPFIHASFSFLLGWKEYMPFWNIPSLIELLAWK